MAESEDALVSNTSGAIHPGSIPGLGTTSGCKCLVFTAAFLLLGSQKQQHSHITNDIYNIYTTKKSHKHFFLLFTAPFLFVLWLVCRPLFVLVTYDFNCCHFIENILENNLWFSSIFQHHTK